MRSLRPRLPVLAASLLTFILVLSILVLGLREEFPMAGYGRSPTLAPYPEADEDLICLLWSERFIDLLVQAALVVLAATACISAVRLWRGER